MSVTPDKAQWGIRNLAFALRNTDGTFRAVVKHPGAENLAISASDNTSNRISADNGLYYDGSGAGTKNGELRVAKFSDWVLINLLGQIAEGGGIGEGLGASRSFAMLFETDGDQGGERVVWYDCTMGQISKTFASTDADGNITEASETATITGKLTTLPNGNKRRAWKCSYGSAHYDDFFDEVFFPDGTDSDATLDALTITNIDALAPTFSSETIEYSATATAATSTITATETDTDAAVAIVINGDSLTNGGTVTWAEGSNTVVITVTNGDAEKTYTITVASSS